MPPAKRSRRTPEQLVADLQAKIAQVQARAAQAKVRKDPALRHMTAALRSIDKAHEASADKATREALSEARAKLAGYLALDAASADGAGTLVPPSRRVKPASDRVLAYITKHPGSRSEQIAAELGTDALSLRAVLHQLREDGRVKAEGKARATRYSVVGRG